MKDKEGKEIHPLVKGRNFSKHLPSNIRIGGQTHSVSFAEDPRQLALDLRIVGTEIPRLSSTHYYQHRKGNTLHEWGHIS